LTTLESALCSVFAEVGIPSDCFLLCVFMNHSIICWYCCSMSFLK
jgi:hypothetical protein